MEAEGAFFESSDKTKIWYDYTKGSKKETLVFLHGLTGSSSAWDFIYPFFEKQGYPILRMDMRGHGLSEKPQGKGKYSIKNITEDLFSILKKEKIGKIIIIAHCYGTFVAQEFYSLHKEHVKKLVLISSNISFRSDWRIFLSTRFVYSLYLISYPFLGPLHFEKNKKHTDYRKFEKSWDFDLIRLYNDICLTSFRVFFPLYLEMMGFDFSDLMKKIDIPVLILHGDRDIAFPVRCAFRINAAIKGSRLEILKAGHIPLLSSHKEVLELLSKFL
jgi:pimeloyl-ACP methyl ester carboxylesterase